MTAGRGGGRRGWSRQPGRWLLISLPLLLALSAPAWPAARDAAPDLSARLLTYAALGGLGVALILLLVTRRRPRPRVTAAAFGVLALAAVAYLHTLPPGLFPSPFAARLDFEYPNYAVQDRHGGA